MADHSVFKADILSRMQIRCPLRVRSDLDRLWDFIEMPFSLKNKTKNLLPSLHLLPSYRLKIKACWKWMGTVSISNGPQHFPGRYLRHIKFYFTKPNDCNSNSSSSVKICRWHKGGDFHTMWRWHYFCLQLLISANFHARFDTLLRAVVCAT